MRRFPLPRRTWILALSGLLLVAVLAAPWPLDAAAPEDRTIAITARAFAFEPETIRVPRGTRLTLSLESLDAAHGLSLDGHAVNMTAEPGHAGQVTFSADSAGKFKFRCSVTCGALHPFMIGELVVEPEYPFARAALGVLVIGAGALAWFWQR